MTGGGDKRTRNSIYRTSEHAHHRAPRCIVRCWAEGTAEDAPRSKDGRSPPLFLSIRPFPQENQATNPKIRGMFMDETRSKCAETPLCVAHASTR